MPGMIDPSSIVDQLDLKPGMRVADFGSGSGHLTLLIARRVGESGRVTALDVQEPPLEMLREKAREANLTNIDAVRANLEVLGSSRLADGSQDAVFMAQILYQTPKKQDVIREAARILKPGGILVIIEWDKGKGGPGPSDEYRMSLEETQQLVTGEGLAFQRSLQAGTFHHAVIFTK